MGTQDATPGTTTPIDDAERRAWFAAFGYKGDLDERVTLHTTDGNRGIDMAVADVWTVRRGLVALLNDDHKFFHRTCNWAVRDRRPIDRADLLREDRFGPLTHPVTGDWLPGRRQLVCLLTEVEEDDVFFKLRERPLAPKQETAKAA